MFIHFSKTLKFFVRSTGAKELLAAKMLANRWNRISVFLNALVQMAACKTNITYIAQFTFKFQILLKLFSFWKFGSIKEPSFLWCVVMRFFFIERKLSAYLFSRQKRVFFSFTWRLAVQNLLLSSVNSLFRNDKSRFKMILI